MITNAKAPASIFVEAGAFIYFHKNFCYNARINVTVHALHVQHAQFLRR